MLTHGRRPANPAAMIDEAQIRAALPAEVAERVQSVRVREAGVTIVADASGLPRGPAEAMQLALETAARGVAGAGKVRVALMADRPARSVIAIGSGKGGVGKSTLTANLAVALAQLGRRVGVVDADIYGPSQPMLLGAGPDKPRARDQQLIATDTPWGVKLLSMGQLVDPDRAIAWRGPMIGNALTQMMDADWGDAELLLVDLPPGTGDVQLTMLKNHRPDAAIIVSTPQDLALIDAKRAIDLFRQARVPIAGMVENMAGYRCPSCGDVSDPFGSGGVGAAAAALDLPVLGRVPLELAIRQDSDAGTPPARDADGAGAAFTQIAQKLSTLLDRVAQ